MTIFSKLFKREESSQLQVGNWVNSYSKGIYRIETIVDQFYDESYPALGENKIGDRIKDRIIVTKRFLNSKFKKSFSYESCSETFVSKLNNGQYSELQKVIEQNPKLLEEFNEYEIPTRETIYNMQLQIDNESDLKKVNGLVDFIKTGKSFLEIQTEMERADLLKLKPKHFGNYLFQLINYNDEYLNRKKIWRNAKLTKK
ncbi:MAG: hypothetical protein AB3N18_16875 [Allomuricauda sp.]